MTVPLSQRVQKELGTIGYSGMIEIEGCYCDGVGCHDGNGMFRLSRRWRDQHSLSYVTLKGEKSLGQNDFMSEPEVLSLTRDPKLRLLSEGHQEECPNWQRPVIINLESLRLRQRREVGFQPLQGGAIQKEVKQRRYNNKMRRRGKSV